MKINKIKQNILEAFEENPEQSISELVLKTSIAKRTAQRYVNELMNENRLEAFGKGRARHYKRVYRNEEAFSNLALLRENEHIGTLIFGNGSYSFAYEKGFEDTLYGISSTDNNVNQLYPLFENLIPEHHRRDKLLHGTCELGAVLSELKNAHGNFQFIPLHELFKVKSTAEKRPSWIEIKHKILGENIYPNLIDAPLQIEDAILDDISNTEHSNLSGYQHKIDVDFINGAIVETKMNAGYILKPLNRTLLNYFERKEEKQKNKYPYLALNEHLFMTFAKNELKLDVPMSGILLAKHGDFHYLVKRYDRYENYAYGQFDIAQLLTMPSDKKYNTTTEEVLKIFAKKVSMQQAREDMLKFQIYSMLIKHSDFHAKNMGVMEVGRKKFIGTPLYDVISVGIYKGTAGDLGLPLSQKNRKTKKYDFEDMIFISKLLEIPITKAKEIIKKTIETYLDKFPEYIEKTKLFEQAYELKMHNIRRGTKFFSDRLQSLYDKKLIELKKLGILQALGIIEKYGGILQSQRNILEIK